MLLRSIKFMSLMVCSALKMHCFQMFVLFCQKKIATFKKSYHIRINDSSFQVKRNILLKKKNMHGCRTCWVKIG